MKNPEKTFVWIVSLLQARGVPFVVVGGLAAKSYGSPRPLNDIDIDIPDASFDIIRDAIGRYAVFGPARYRDERWDVLLATLNHEGQEIDISGGDSTKICDVRTREWIASPTDFSAVERREIFGIIVPVQTREHLVAYKSMLAGEHQQDDIRAIQDFKLS